MATDRACSRFQRRAPPSQHGTLGRPKGPLLHKRTGPGSGIPVSWRAPFATESLLTTPGKLIGRAARGKHQVSSEEEPAGAEAPHPEPGRPDAGEVGGEEGPRGARLEGPRKVPGGAPRRRADARQSRQQGRVAP